MHCFLASTIVLASTSSCKLVKLEGQRLTLTSKNLLMFVVQREVIMMMVSSKREISSAM
jgi:hypothetical protein